MSKLLAYHRGTNEYIPIETFQEADARAEAERREDTRLKALYESDPEIKRLAEEIHERRMMTPPACCQCIAMAEQRLKKRPHERKI